MKISVNQWMLDGKKTVPEAIAEARRAGFDAVELAIAAEGPLTPDTTETECRDILAAAKAIGIEISSLASGQSWTWSPTSGDPVVRRKIIAFTRKALRMAAWLRTDAYLFVPGAVDVPWMPDAEIVPYDVCLRRAAGAIRRLIPTAERLGVSLCVENVWNKLLLSPLEMRDFVDAFRSPRVGVYFDAGNVLLLGYPEHWIRILGRRIRRVHVKDFKKSVGTLNGFCDLGEGDVDFKAVRRALRSVRYNGYITAEIPPYDPVRLKKTAETMKDLFG